MVMRAMGTSLHRTIGDGHPEGEARDGALDRGRLKIRIITYAKRRDKRLISLPHDAGTTSVQCCSFFVFAAASRHCVIAALLLCKSSAADSKSCHAPGLPAFINEMPACQ